MLQVELVEASQVKRAAHVFHRDGFVVVPNALTGDQLSTMQAGANRIIEQQLAETELEKANRGFARYSFGQQIENPEWQILLDLPTTLPILEEIWGDSFTCGGGGGNYSVPGAKIQKLHADMCDFFHDPLGHINFMDVPTPFIVINYLMVDFTRENGAIRFVPCTQRSRGAIPDLDSEPEWMKNSILCAPDGTAVIRDVRCWHGGTANTSNMIRPMVSAGYYAPWFRGGEPSISRATYNRLSPRAQKMCRSMVALEA